MGKRNEAAGSGLSEWRAVAGSAVSADSQAPARGLACKRRGAQAPKTYLNS